MTTFPTTILQCHKPVALKHVAAVTVEYAAGRAYDKAYLIHRPTSEAQDIINSLNFPMHDYVCDPDSAVQAAAAAAVIHLASHPKQSKAARKRKRTSLDSGSTHKAGPASKRRATSGKHAAAAVPANPTAITAATAQRVERQLPGDASGLPAAAGPILTSMGQAGTSPQHAPATASSGRPALDTAQRHHQQQQQLQQQAGVPDSKTTQAWEILKGDAPKAGMRHPRPEPRTSGAAVAAPAAGQTAESLVQDSPPVAWQPQHEMARAMPPLPAVDTLLGMLAQHAPPGEAFAGSELPKAGLASTAQPGTNTAGTGTGTAATSFPAATAAASSSLATAGGGSRDGSHPQGPRQQDTQAVKVNWLSHPPHATAVVETVHADESDNDVEIMDSSPGPQPLPSRRRATPVPLQRTRDPRQAATQAASSLRHHATHPPPANAASAAWRTSSQAQTSSFPLSSQSQANPPGPQARSQPPSFTSVPVLPSGIPAAQTTPAATSSLPFPLSAYQVGQISGAGFTLPNGIPTAAVKSEPRRQPGPEDLNGAHWPRAVHAATQAAGTGLSNGRGTAHPYAASLKVHVKAEGAAAALKPQGSAAEAAAASRQQPPASHAQAAAVKQYASASNAQAAARKAEAAQAGSSSAHPLELSDSEPEREPGAHAGHESSTTSSSVHAKPQASIHSLHADTAASARQQTPPVHHASQQVPKGEGYRQQVPWQVPQQLHQQGLRPQPGFHQHLPRQMPQQVTDQLKQHCVQAACTAALSYACPHQQCLVVPAVAFST